MKSKYYLLLLILLSFGPQAAPAGFTGEETCLSKRSGPLEDLSGELEEAVEVISGELTGSKGEAVIQQVGELVKSKVAGLTPEGLRELMIGHYKQMWLMNEDGTWALDKLQARDGKLLPNLSIEDVNRFIDRMVEVNSKNDYLMYFLSKVAGKKFERLSKKFDEEGVEVLESAIAFAFALEFTTNTMIDDWTVLAESMEFWDKIIKDKKLKKGMGLPYRIKYISIHAPLANSVKNHERGLDDSYLKQTVPINMLEAALFDRINGHEDNRQTGLIMSHYNPNGRKAKKFLGRKGAKAKWSKDGKKVKFGVPLEEQWADMYLSWQMGFLAPTKQTPFSLSKLVIPTVADHYDDSSQFLNTRGVALFITMHHSLDMVGRKPSESNSIIDDMDWSDPELTAAWGEANYESALLFEKDVEEALDKAKEKKKRDRRDK